MRCPRLPHTGGTSWWVQLVTALGGELSEAERDVLLPMELTDVTPPGADGPISLPLVPPPGLARFVQVVLPADGAMGKRRAKESVAHARGLGGKLEAPGDEARAPNAGAWTAPAKLRLPSNIEAMASGDAFAANALTFNPAPPRAGPGMGRDAHRDSIARGGLYSTY